MIQIAVLLFSVLIALFFWYVVVGKTRPSIIRPLFVISLIVLPISFYLVISQSIDLQKQLGVQSRPTVAGTVTEAVVVGERAIRPKITYTYEIDSITYIQITHLNAPMFGNKRKQYDVAHTLTEEHPVGSKVVVYYNPLNPTEATMSPTVKWDTLGKIGFGAVLLMLSLFALLLPLKRKR